MIQHPDITLSERYGADAPFVRRHSREPMCVDNCNECHADIMEGEVYYTLNGRSYCETCIEYARTTAETKDANDTKEDT